MTHIITSLCLRDNGCSDVCPVESINAGTPVEEFPTYYIDASTCIDCGACVPECPFHAIYPEDEVPAAYKAIGGELINEVGLAGEYNGKSHHGETVALSTTRALATGEVVDLRKAIQENRRFYS
ncbi:MAG: ferredoxin family protein [Anaerolineales bacterium]|nr:ferredoxin family protein [Anaerolineales bacterium]MCB9143871.1 ferredoxin family protein [Anaerolineales bacterium]